MHPTPHPRVRPWADLVFHVLAHVEVSERLRASLYDARYVAFVEEHLGPAEGRLLAQDALLLATRLETEESLGDAQLLAWLFETPEEATRASGLELGELPVESVRDAGALVDLARAAPIVEVLRTACEIEAEHHAKLPPIEVDDAALDMALYEAAAASPTLPSYRVAVIRSLRVRGRMRGEEIWVGAPDDFLGIGAEHVAWQAAHEATVRELSRHARALRFSDADEIEHAALFFTTERARAAGMELPHGRWLRHFDPRTRALAARAPGSRGQLLIARARRENR